jgi:hypothetical protein
VIGTDHCNGGTTVKLLGMLAVSVRKVKAVIVKVDTVQTVKMELHRLVKVGRICYVSYINCMT